MSILATPITVRAPRRGSWWLIPRHVRGRISLQLVVVSCIDKSGGLWLVLGVVVLVLGVGLGKGDIERRMWVLGGVPWWWRVVWVPVELGLRWVVWVPEVGVSLTQIEP